MAKVLTTGSSITCSHSGTVTPKSQAKLQVGGNPVLLTNQVSTWTVSGCTTPTDSAHSKMPCTTVSLSGADATKLTCGGKAVLLEGGTASAPTAKPSTSTITIKASQDKVTAS